MNYYYPQAYYPMPNYTYVPTHTNYNGPFRSQTPTAYAKMKGGPLAPNLKGYVIFIEVPNGTEVFTEISGLPPYQPAKGNGKPIGPHGFHLHENGSCEVGDEDSPFKSAGGHWNPNNEPHGNHAGDFPVLFSNDGYARMSFFTNKFKIKDIIGKAVIIHQSPDDYRSQPSGDAGKRLACGVIKEVTQQM